MLALARKKDDTVVIGDVITVKVIEVRNTRVLLGFQAPPEFRVLRGELHPPAEAQYSLWAYVEALRKEIQRVDEAAQAASRAAPREGTPCMSLRHALMSCRRVLDGLERGRGDDLQRIIVPNKHPEELETADVDG